MRSASPFTAAQRERIAAFVSHRNGCAFCRDSHNEALRHLGGEPEPLPDGAHTKDSLAPILELVARINDDPAAVAQADVDAVLAAGWNETAVEHAVLVCGFFNLMNRWVEGLGIPSDPQIVRQAGAMLCERGYRGDTDMLGA